MNYSKSDCIEALKEARARLQKSPTMREYNEIDISPSSDTIVRNFGSWNAAKRKAGLETNKVNNVVQEKPEGLDIPDNKEWRSLTPYQRYYYKNREKEKERSKKRAKELKRWFKEYKKGLECEECGEDNPVCLDFHHSGEKDRGVSELVTQTIASKDRIKEEVQKCAVLCANCHRKRHSKI